MRLGYLCARLGYFEPPGARNFTYTYALLYMHMSDGVCFRYLRMHLRDPVRRWSASR
jgi:hypothetical protein